MRKRSNTMSICAAALNREAAKERGRADVPSRASAWQYIEAVTTEAIDYPGQSLKALHPQDSRRQGCQSH